jgi:hypothetical protein
METKMNNTFNEFANQFGTTKKLIRGKPEYVKQTVEVMRLNVIERAQAALQIIKSKEEATSKNPMVRKIRNGLAVKIGYGLKNETLITFGKDQNGKDMVERHFFDENRNDAIDFLEGAISLIEQGKMDDALEAKLANFRLRAEKGKAARRKTKTKLIASVEQIPKAA